MTATLAGCAGRREGNPNGKDTRTRSTDTGRSVDPTDETGLVTFDPYAGLDWDVVEHHRAEFHNHIRGGVAEPADVVDLYADRGYTVYAVADKGYAPMAWPWTAFSEIDEKYEDRDPEEMGVVAFPGCEFTLREHVQSIFTTLNHGGLAHDNAVQAALASAAESIPAVSYSGSIEGPVDQVAAVVDRTDRHVPSENGGLAVLNHPKRYYDDPDEDWRRYVDHFEAFGTEDGFVGLEAFNKEAGENEDVQLWDNLLEAFAPDRMIWGFGTDDPNDYVVGRDVDRRWTTLLLEERQFDPTNQHRSRVAAVEAFRSGRTLCHQRAPWDESSEEPPPVPHVASVDVDTEGAEITVDASGYDTLEWISSGEVVSTDPTVSLTAERAPYVRAHLSNDAGGETSTQPFGIRAH